MVHEFTVANFDDPDVYAAQPLWEWQQTEKGKWIMKHAVEAPTWTKSLEYERYEYRFVVVAKLESKDYTYYQLKFN